MSIECLPTALRIDKFILIEPVLKKFYPELQLGRVKDPIEPVICTLERLGIRMHSNTLSGYRVDSRRNGRYPTPQIGELLLLNALCRRDSQWATPSPASAMALITETGLALNQYSRSNVRQSAGLTQSIAEVVCKEKPENITPMIRGIRIDGASIAEELPLAWEQLKRVVNHFTSEYEALPLWRQKNRDMTMDMKNARTPRQLYTALYKNAHGGRRIATFVPYELNYWKWLIDEGIIASYKHLPFTNDVLDEYAHGFFTTNIQICKKVTERTGIPVDDNVIQQRMRMIRNDLPDGFT